MFTPISSCFQLFISSIFAFLHLCNNLYLLHSPVFLYDVPPPSPLPFLLHLTHYSLLASDQPCPPTTSHSLLLLRRWNIHAHPYWECSSSSSSQSHRSQSFQRLQASELTERGGGKKVRWWGRKSEEWVEEREEVKAERKQVGDRAVERWAVAEWERKRGSRMMSERLRSSYATSNTGKHMMKRIIRICLTHTQTHTRKNRLCRLSTKTKKTTGRYSASSTSDIDRRD